MSADGYGGGMSAELRAILQKRRAKSQSSPIRGQQQETTVSPSASNPYTTVPAPALAPATTITPTTFTSRRKDVKSIYTRDQNLPEANSARFKHPPLPKRPTSSPPTNVGQRSTTKALLNHDFFPSTKNIRDSSPDLAPAPTPTPTTSTSLTSPSQDVKSLYTRDQSLRGTNSAKFKHPQLSKRPMSSPPTIAGQRATNKALLSHDFFPSNRSIRDKWSKTSVSPESVKTPSSISSVTRQKDEVVTGASKLAAVDAERSYGFPANGNADSEQNELVVDGGKLAAFETTERFKFPINGNPDSEQNELKDDGGKLAAFDTSHSFAFHPNGNPDSEQNELGDDGGKLAAFDTSQSFAFATNGNPDNEQDEIRVDRGQLAAFDTSQSFAFPVNGNIDDEQDEIRVDRGQLAAFDTSQSFAFPANGNVDDEQDEVRVDGGQFAAFDTAEQFAFPPNVNDGEQDEIGVDGGQFAAFDTAQSLAFPASGNEESEQDEVKVDRGSQLAAFDTAQSFEFPVNVNDSGQDEIGVDGGRLAAFDTTQSLAFPPKMNTESKQVMHGVDKDKWAAFDTAERFTFATNGNVDSEQDELVSGRGELDAFDTAERFTLPANVNDSEQDELVVETKKLTAFDTAEPFASSTNGPTNGNADIEKEDLMNVVSDEKEACDDLDARYTEETVERLYEGEDVPIHLKSYEVLSSKESDGTPPMSTMTMNPLNGNVILYRQRRGCCFIDEIDPSSPRSVVQSVSVSVSQLRNRMKSSDLLTRIPCGASVVQIAAGLHKQQGKVRVRVAAIVKLKFLMTDSDSEYGTRSNRGTICAVWQWGYGQGHPVQLQSVISTPLGSPGSDYNPATLCVADGLLFMGGHDVSTKPAIFIAKPHVRDSWLVNTLPEDQNALCKTLKGGTKVVGLSNATYSHRPNRYLAIALDNGSLTVWRYDRAVTKNSFTSQDGKADSMLDLFCELDTTQCFEDIGGDVMIPHDESCGKEVSTSPESSNIVTDMCWIPSRSYGTSLAFLAVASKKGVAIYNASFSRHDIVTSSNSSRDNISNNGNISNHGWMDYTVAPIAIAKDIGDTKSGTDSIGIQSLVTWFDFGPIMPPGIFVMSQTSEISNIYIASLDLRPMHEASETIPSLMPICKDSLPSSSCPWGALSFNSSIGSVICQRGRSLTAFYPSVKVSKTDPSPWKDSLFFSTFHSVGSVSSGVDSRGQVLNNYGRLDNSFHIHTQLSCKRLDIDGQKHLQRPVLRHWLCKTAPGDHKRRKEEKNAGSDSSYPTGGALTSMLGEVTVFDEAVNPCRICADERGDIVAVLYSPIVQSTKFEATYFTLIHTNVTDKCDSKRKLHGATDVAFLSENPGKGSSSLIVLDGVSVKKAVFNISLSLESEEFITEIDSSVKGRRVFVLSTGVVCVGSAQNHRECIVHLGKCDRYKKVQKNTTKMWFEHGEQVISIVELPSSENSKETRCAILTTQRVLIMCSREFSILKEIEAGLPCHTLVPLGSHCVGFLSNPLGHGLKSVALRYLSCLKKDQSDGVIATLPLARSGYNPYLLLTVRPDRIVYLSSHIGSSVYDSDEKDQMLMVPIAQTRPVSLLQPLIANALSQCNRNENSGDLVVVDLLHTIIERFGRKSTPLPHNENEGIGTNGYGVTSAVYEMLHKYGYTDIISDNAIKRNLGDSAVLSFPPWVSMQTKEVVSGYESQFDTLASGDSSLLDYLKQPSNLQPCVLPKIIDPVSSFSRKFAVGAMKQNDVYQAVKLLDLAGSPSSEKDLLHIILSMQLTSDEGIDHLLRELSSKTEGNRSSGAMASSSSSLAVLALNLRERKKHIDQQSEDESVRWINPLSPSFHNGVCRTKRQRNTLLQRVEELLDKNGENESNSMLKKSLRESNNVWSVGPFNSKEEILLLDNIEEWLGRCHPMILGREGAEVAAESGERALQQILAAASENNGKSDDEDSTNSFKHGWVDGVGEGRSDEENLTLYMRLCEGTDEDDRWKTDGLLNDLSKYQNKVRVPASSGVNIEATTSNVDEGESGKVKLLHDIVFTSDPGPNDMSGMIVEVKRGSSLDTGLLHSSTNESRQRFSLEFWYFLPEQLSKEIVLARRSVCFPGEMMECLCHVAEKDGLLWELAVLPSGRLEFRTKCESLKTSETLEETLSDRNDDYDMNEERNDLGLVTWKGWNHVCITFSARDMEDIFFCSVSLMMRGVPIISSARVRVQLPGLEECQMSDIDLIDETLERSAIILGLGSVSGFRMTEIRCWACERSPSDIKMMMYEYLPAAETKRKIKVRIRSKVSAAKKDTKALLGNTLDVKTAALFAPPSGSTRNRKSLISDQNETKENEIEYTQFGDSTTTSEFFETNEEYDDFETSAVGSAFNFPEIDSNQPQESTSAPRSDSAVSIEVGELFLLSNEVRSSAAAALIRGPPATRHFGGNRGGLHIDSKNHPYSSRSGVNSIAICGSEKTVILYHGDRPSGKTYPIGASGAIVSDLTSDGKEYLCCFLAKDKRMVVFELHSKTVVVELQMTMKLNFWRFLPPEAHASKLTFMLITPIGGFHWCPLDESPRPKQAWKRGSALQGKKIVAYEEGGTSDLQAGENRSTVALLLASVEDDRVEAWCLPLLGKVEPTCLSTNIKGAALYCPPINSEESNSFDPYIVTITKIEEDFVLEVACLINDPTSETAISKGDVIAHVTLDNAIVDDTYSEPALAMGITPDTFCLCNMRHIVVIVRATGLLYSFMFQDDYLRLIGTRNLHHYVVDAAIKAGENDGDAEVVLLLCEQDNLKDGRIFNVKISHDTVF